MNVEILVAWLIFGGAGTIGSHILMKLVGAPPSTQWIVPIIVLFVSMAVTLVALMLKYLDRNEPPVKSRQENDDV